MTTGDFPMWAERATDSPTTVILAEQNCTGVLAVQKSLRNPCQAPLGIWGLAMYAQHTSYRLTFLMPGRTCLLYERMHQFAVFATRARLHPTRNIYRKGTHTPPSLGYIQGS